MNISVPDDLAERVRELDLPISQVCQTALRHAADGRETALVRDLSRMGYFPVRAVDGSDAYYVITQVRLGMPGLRLETPDRFTLEQAEAWCAAELERWKNAGS